MTNTQADAAPRRPWTEGLTGYHWLVLAVACFGWLFDTMDQWFFVAAKQPALAELLHVGVKDPLVAKWIGTTTMWMMFGWATGGLIFGVIGDRIGRKWTIAITILLYSLFTGLSGLAQTPLQLTIFRFLTGLGIGGEFAAGAALVAETFPSHSRTTALGVVQATSALGNVMAGLIWMLFGDVLGWRTVFFLGVIPAFLVFIIIAFIREPEAWREKHQQAKAGDVKFGNMLELFTNRTLLRNTFVGAMLAVVGVSYFWGLGVWSPELIRTVVPPEKAAWASGWVIVAQNSGAFFGALTFAWMAQRWGRKPAFITALVACAIVVPTAFMVTSTFVQAIILFALVGYVLLTLFGGFAVYFPELYPTRLRTTGTGFCYNVARYLAAFAPLALGSLVGLFGLPKSVLIVSTTIFIVGILVMTIAPETKDKPLPE